MRNHRFGANGRKTTGKGPLPGNAAGAAGPVARTLPGSPGNCLISRVWGRNAGGCPFTLPICSRTRRTFPQPTTCREAHLACHLLLIPLGELEFEPQPLQSYPQSRKPVPQAFPQVLNGERFAKRKTQSTFDRGEIDLPALKHLHQTASSVAPPYAPICLPGALRPSSGSRRSPSRGWPR